MDSDDERISISEHVKSKLKTKHNVVKVEIEQCFINFTSNVFLTDTRDDHLTNPPTLWFISETDTGRLLKICFIKHVNGRYYVKTAYEPNQVEIDLFAKYSQ